MYHLKLIKSRSYTGIVTATKENPDVFVKDKAIADAAVATGYFELVGETDGEGSADAGEQITGHLEKGQLESMEYNDLKKLAADLGVDTKIVKKKADLIEAVAAIEVGIPKQEETPGSEENEVDYGETDGEGSPTMVSLQEQ